MRRPEFKARGNYRARSGSPAPPGDWKHDKFDRRSPGGPGPRGRSPGPRSPLRSPRGPPPDLRRGASSPPPHRPPGDHRLKLGPPPEAPWRRPSRSPPPGVPRVPRDQRTPPSVRAPRPRHLRTPPPTSRSPCREDGPSRRKEERPFPPEEGRREKEREEKGSRERGREDKEERRGREGRARPSIPDSEADMSKSNTMTGVSGDWAVFRGPELGEIDPRCHAMHDFH